MLHVLQRIARGDLPAAQLLAGIGGVFGQVLHDVTKVDDLFQPFAKWLAGGQTVLDLGIVVHPAVPHIDGDHLARPQRALFAHIGFIDRHHADLGTRDQQVVPGHDIAHRPQPVAVQSAADPAAIGHRQRRGAVPRFHHRVAIGVHVGPCLWHVGGGLGPAFGNQHGLGHRRIAARAHHHLEHRIQRGGIRRSGGHDGLDILGHVAKGAAGHADFMAAQPVQVALQRVDLAVMGQHAEGLGQPPLREGIGGITLVIDRKGRFEAFVLQIGIEFRHLFGQHHPLVDDRAAGQRTEIQVVDLRGHGGLLDPAADDIQLALELDMVDILFAADQDLFDLGAGGVGLFAQNGGVHRDVAPAIDVMAHAQHFGFDDGPAGFLLGEIRARQEHLTDRDQLVLVGFVSGAAHLIVEERHRDLHMDARAVAGLAIRIHRAAMPDRLQRVDAVLHHLPAGFAVQIDHEAHSARGMLVLGAIQAVFGHPVAAGLFFCLPAVGLAVLAHSWVPSR